jgi:hypothetical protein
LGLTDFFDKNPEKLVVQLKEVLYDRLKDVRKAEEMKSPPDDDFELGINCRLANESVWLHWLLTADETRSQ